MYFLDLTYGTNDFLIVLQEILPEKECMLFIFAVQIDICLSQARLMGGGQRE